MYKEKGIVLVVLNNVLSCLAYDIENFFRKIKQ